jgi:hypothetical protein
MIVREYINEKFTPSGDPIEDLHIGKPHWFDEVKEALSNIAFEAEIIMEVYDDLLEELYISDVTPKEAANICKREWEINNLESVNEVFTDKSDPIKDMGIGLSPGQYAHYFLKEMGGNIEKISLTYFGDKKHLGYAYVLYDFFRRIEYMGYSSLQKEFFRSCENENYHGDREDIIEDRTIIANVLKEYFNIEVDPLIYNHPH